MRTDYLDTQLLHPRTDYLRKFRIGNGEVNYLAFRVSIANRLGNRRLLDEIIVQILASAEQKFLNRGRGPLHIHINLAFTSCLKNCFVTMARQAILAQIVAWARDKCARKKNYTKGAFLKLEAL
ncbi:MAG TPA: hypothetical protein VGC21_02785 [Telluria sp.]